MNRIDTKCIKVVGEKITCRYCEGKCIKHGKIGAKQRYRCNSCGRTFIIDYSYNGYKPAINNRITRLVKEGCGIRSIARLLEISATTVLRRILAISKNIQKPAITTGKIYEVDEIRTFYKCKTRLIWLVYALRKDTKEVADFAIGRRTKKTLQKVIGTVLLSGPEKIHTDKLSLYNSVIPGNIHDSKRYGTNHIERKNLTLRTHLKRLNRRTICFSKSLAVFAACLKIYFWS